MKKTFIYIAGIVLVLIAGFLILNSYIYKEKQGDGPNENNPGQSATYPKNAVYTVGGHSVKLQNGISEISVPGSSAQVVTKYFGNEVWHDITGDGRDDLAFIVVQQTGGSGSFYYVVAAISNSDGTDFNGSHGLLLGDRIAPQTMRALPNGLIEVTYADRKPGESFVVQPSVGKSLRLKFDKNSMQFGEVVANFEGEADPSRMTLGMKKWDWTHALYNDGRKIVPKNVGVFSLTFNNNGTFSATTDCNSMGGSYSVGANKQITFSNMVSTLMFCEGSLEGEFSNLLQNTVSYSFTSRGELIFDLKFDSGTAVFR